MLQPTAQPLGTVMESTPAPESPDIIELVHKDISRGPTLLKSLGIHPKGTQDGPPSKPSWIGKSGRLLTDKREKTKKLRRGAAKVRTHPLLTPSHRRSRFLVAPLY